MAHRPDEALRLVDEYLSRFPDGALQQEALALGMDASETRDPTRAALFTARYLKRFPSGRFKEFAARIVGEKNLER